MRLKSLPTRIRPTDLSSVRTLERRQGQDASSDRKVFYDSALWQRIRHQKLRRDPLCQYCAVDGIVTEAIEVDHYEPIDQGGDRTADANLVSACKPCHSRKTLCERHGTTFPPFAPSAPRTYTVA